jgi:pimeloyl-ACP methyl ester carboxylesterase
VILEAGYTASGIDTFATLLPELAQGTRTCTYDRAGDGVSDARPASVQPLTGATQADELHALLDAIDVAGPYVMVGHSYGGVISREFAGRYPGEVEGMVLIDATSEPEIPVYDRLHAGAWDDGTVTPAPNQRIDIHATVRELHSAPPLGATPLVVITAGILEDAWLKTVPALEAKAQTRLAGLSTHSVHAIDRGIGHMIPDEDPASIVDATTAVVEAVRADAPLPACTDVFAGDTHIRCLTRTQVAIQDTG